MSNLILCIMAISVPFLILHIYFLIKDEDFKEGDYLTFFSEPEYEFVNKNPPVFKVLKVGKKTYLLENIRTMEFKYQEHLKSKINNCYKKVDYNE